MVARAGLGMISTGKLPGTLAALCSSLGVLARRFHFGEYEERSIGAERFLPDLKYSGG